MMQWLSALLFGFLYSSMWWNSGVSGMVIMLIFTLMGYMLQRIKDE